jgi:hypothetical protein
MAKRPFFLHAGAGILIALGLRVRHIDLHDPRCQTQAHDHGNQQLDHGQATAGSCARH